MAHKQEDSAQGYRAIHFIKNVDGSVHITLSKTLEAVFAMVEFRKEIENSSVVPVNDNNTAVISLLKECFKNLEANKLAWAFFGN